MTNEIEKLIEEIKDLYAQIESKKKLIRTKQAEKWNKQSNPNTTNKP
jgi:hypothetical protein